MAANGTVRQPGLLNDTKLVSVVILNLASGVRNVKGSHWTQIGLGL